MNICIYKVLGYTLVAVHMCSSLILHVYIYENDGYEDSSSKWYLLSGVMHPGMAMVEPS
jgi:hypothetical protein